MPLAATPDTPYPRRFATLLAGLVLVAVGVAVTIRAEIGVAPYDVLTTGMVARFDIPIGVAAMILPALFVSLGWALGHRPGPGTFLSVLLVGPMLGATLRALPEVEPLAVRVPLFALGFVVICSGITATVVATLGPGPAEVVMLAIHERGHPLAPVRTGIELTCVAIGWALGGQVGVGTIVFALGIGVTLRWMLARAGYESSHIAEATDIAAPGA